MKTLTLVSIFVGIGLVGCTDTTSQTKMQFMPDMADSPTVKAYESIINPPEGSVATNAILYPKDAESTAKLMSNPYPVNNPQVVEKGKKLWNTFCITCHGEVADGKHKLKGGYPPPPDLRVDFYKKKKDGFFFHKITFGGALMPGYGYAIEPAERWQIIAYLRKLQNEGGK